MSTKSLKVRVERVITEQATVAFAVDQEEFDEWLDGLPGGTDEDFIDFLVAHRDWPENIEEQIPYGTRWTEQYRDYVLMVK